MSWADIEAAARARGCGIARRWDRLRSYGKGGTTGAEREAYCLAARKARRDAAHTPSALGAPGRLEPRLRQAGPVADTAREHGGYVGSSRTGGV